MATFSALGAVMLGLVFKDGFEEPPPPPVECEAIPGRLRQDRVEYRINNVSQPAAVTYADMFGEFPLDPTLAGSTFTVRTVVGRYFALPFVAPAEFNTVSFTWVSFFETSLGVTASVSTCPGGLLEDDAVCLVEGTAGGGIFNIGDDCPLEPGRTYYFNIADMILNRDGEPINTCFPALGVDSCEWRVQPSGG